MLQNFVPDLIYDNVYDIDYDQLYNKGIRLLIFDIDGTILKSMNFSVSDKLIDLIAGLRIKGFTITLLTNAGNRRLYPVLEKTTIESGIASARKPKSEGFEKVMKEHIFPKEQTAMIGNDLYADIYGANKFGITSIFIGSLDLKPIENKITKGILKKVKTFQQKKKENG